MPGVRRPADVHPFRPGAGPFRGPHPASSRTAGRWRPGLAHRPPVAFTGRGRQRSRLGDIIRSLTQAGITRDHADAIVSAMRSVADQDDHPTKAHCDTTIDNLSNNLREHTAAAVSAAETRICRAMLVQTLAILGGLLAILRLLG